MEVGVGGVPTRNPCYNRTEQESLRHTFGPLSGHVGMPTRATQRGPATWGRLGALQPVPVMSEGQFVEWWIRARRNSQGAVKGPVKGAVKGAPTSGFAAPSHAAAMWRCSASLQPP